MKNLFIRIKLLLTALKLRILGWLMSKKKSPLGLPEYESLGEVWIPSQSLLMSELEFRAPKKPSCTPPKAKAVKGGSGSRRSTKPKGKS